MKVVLIGSMYPPYAFGGAEKAIAMLAEALVGRGHDVVVLTLHPGASEKTEERNGIRIYHLPLDNVYWPFTQQAKPNWLLRLAWHLREMWNWKAARRIGRILDLETPDVVHTHNIIGFSVAIWRAVKRRRIRLVHTLHDYYLLCPRTTLYRHGKSCERRCIGCRLLAVDRKATSRVSDEVVSVSHFTLDKHKSHGFFHNAVSRVIYNIQPTSGDRMPGAVPRQIRRFDFRLHWQNRTGEGIEVVLQATRYLTRPGWRLNIAGNARMPTAAPSGGSMPMKGSTGLALPLPPSFTHCRRSCDFVPVGRALAYVFVEGLHEGKSLICGEPAALLRSRAWAQ